MQAFAVLFALACLAYANASFYGYPDFGYKGLGLLGGIGGYGGYYGGCSPKCARQYVYSGHCGSGCGGCGDYLAGVCKPACVKKYARVGYCRGSCGSCGSVLNSCLGGKKGYGGYGGYYGYPKSGYYPKSTVSIQKGYAGAKAASGESSQSSSHRLRSKKSGEWERTLTTRVKKTVECEMECRRSSTCRRQWSVAHAYWGKCSQCKSC